MSKYVICAIRDDIGEVFMQPVLNLNEKTAERQFIRQLPEICRSISAVPDEMSLWLIGEYDDKLGAISSVPQKFICRGSRIGEVSND